MPKTTIICVEDDPNIAKLIKYNLDRSGFETIVFETGLPAVEYLNRNTVSLIILDIMLPDIDGYEISRRIKQGNRNLQTPLIFLTARGDELDRVVGFELGADDYIVKPFSPRELVLRIKTILKRCRPVVNDLSGDELDYCGLHIDFIKHLVTIKNQPVELTLLEFKLLATMVERRGRVQHRDRLLNDVWGISADITTRTVDTHIKRLRQKLGSWGEENIETVRGMGYRILEVKT